MTDYHLQGGCLCGAVRYCIDGPMAGDGAVFCHCRMCQRAAGAPVVAWAAFWTRDVVFVQGTPAVYRSSPKAVRQFCGRCGGTLSFAFLDAPDSLDIALASLDDPNAITPGCHLWTDSAVVWLALDDHRPRYRDSGRDQRFPDRTG